jgi:hypothetical protein
MSFVVFIFSVAASLLIVLRNACCYVVKEVITTKKVYPHVITPTSENASLNSSFFDLVWYYIYETGTPEINWGTSFLSKCYYSVINQLVSEEFQVILLYILNLYILGNVW